MIMVHGDDENDDADGDDTGDGEYDDADGDGDGDGDGDEDEDAGGDDNDDDDEDEDAAGDDITVAMMSTKMLLHGDDKDDDDADEYDNDDNACVHTATAKTQPFFSMVSYTPIAVAVQPGPSGRWADAAAACLLRLMQPLQREKRCKRHGACGI